jgi:hypothetical protein
MRRLSRDDLEDLDEELREKPPRKKSKDDSLGSAGRKHGKSRNHKTDETLEDTEGFEEQDFDE